MIVSRTKKSGCAPPGLLGGWRTLSYVSTCSLTPGYEEIRLGSYPIPDKNNSHIHPVLCSALTVTWLRDNTALSPHQSDCLSFSWSVCQHVSCFASYFTITRDQTMWVFALCISLVLSLDRIFLKISWSVVVLLKQSLRVWFILTIYSNGIKWPSVYPFDCPAGPG